MASIHPARPRAVSLLLTALFALPACKEASQQQAPERKTEPRPAEPPKEARPAPSLPGTPVVVAGHATGYFTLSDGSLVRRDALGCPNRLPRKLDKCPSHRTGLASGCASDTDCTAKPNGHCASRGLAVGCGCEYGCNGDADCGLGHICVCADPVGYCAESTCESNGLCTSGECKAPPLGVEQQKAGPFSCVKEDRSSGDERPSAPEMK
jgi:hypothetical protein